MSMKYGRPLYFRPVVSFFLLCLFISFFFPRLIPAVADRMSTILLDMLRRSANLECRSEMCCTRLAGNAARKNRQKFVICAPSYNFVGLYLRNEGTCQQSGKTFKQRYLHMSSQYGELWPTNGWDLLASLGHPR